MKQQTFEDCEMRVNELNATIRSWEGITYASPAEREARLAVFREKRNHQLENARSLYNKTPETCEHPEIFRNNSACDYCKCHVPSRDELLMRAAQILQGYITRQQK